MILRIKNREYELIIPRKKVHDGKSACCHWYLKDSSNQIFHCKVFLSQAFIRSSTLNDCMNNAGLEYELNVYAHIRKNLRPHSKYYSNFIQVEHICRNVDVSTFAYDKKLYHFIIREMIKTIKRHKHLNMQTVKKGITSAKISMLVLEQLQGAHSLGYLIHANVALPMRTTLCRELCKVTNYMHKYLKLAHNDMHCDNILTTQNGIVVLDFDQSELCKQRNSWNTSWRDMSCDPYYDNLTLFVEFCDRLHFNPKVIAPAFIYPRGVSLFVDSVKQYLINTKMKWYTWVEYHVKHHQIYVRRSISTQFIR